MLVVPPMRTAAEIAQRLGGKQKGDGWRCHCPAHDDENPSLDITVNEEGKILWICRAGCSNEAVHQALVARGLWGKTKSNAEINYMRTREQSLQARAAAEAKEAEQRHHGRRSMRLALGARDKVSEITRPLSPTAYFKGRGLPTPANALLLPSNVIRKFQLPFKKGFPTVILPMMNATGLTGVQA